MLDYYDILFCRCLHGGRGSKPSGTLYVYEDGTYDVSQYASVRVITTTSYRTVLYADGTFIINESSMDEESNTQAHGEAVNVYNPFDPNGSTDIDKYIFSEWTDVPWSNELDSIINIEIGSEIQPTSTAYWFNACIECQTIDLSNLDTSNVISMDYMFNYCSSLTVLDISNFDTSNVTDMYYAFANLRSMTSLDLSSLDTSNVVNMEGMFTNNNSLTSLDLSSFDTSSVTNMTWMFSNCPNLASLDLSSFDTSSVTSMGTMFRGCSALTILDLSNFDTSNVEVMSLMFSGCSALHSIYASSDFVITNVSEDFDMFKGCAELVGGAGTVWDSNYIRKSRAKIDGGISDPGYFTPPYYGAVWDGSNSPQWTRTGLATDFADPQPAVNNGTGSSPFDNIMPWSGMQIVEDADVGTLVSIPKFYYKWIRNGSAMELQISMQKYDGFLTSPAHADRGDGVGERDMVYVGRYRCSSVDYKSTSGVKPKISTTRANFRTNIHALGTDIWQFDFSMYWTIAMLYLVEYANWNSQATIGYGCGTTTDTQFEGITDAMQYHTGTNVASRDTYGEVQYRYIEGLWSNVWSFIDGLYFNNANVYAINNPSNFSDTINGTLVGIRPVSDGCPLTFTEPSTVGYEYALFPATVSGTDYTVRICDRLHSVSSGVVAYFGGNRKDRDQFCGLFYLGCGSNVSANSSSISSRLVKLPSV